MLIVLLLCGGIALFREFSGYQQEKGQENVLVKWMEQSTMELYLPAVKMREGAAGNMGEGNLWTRLLLYPYPVFLGILEQEEQKPDVCAESDYEQLLLLEGTDEDRKNIAQDDLAYEEDALHLGSEMEDALQKENGLYMENQAALSEQEARERESAETEENNGEQKENNEEQEESRAFERSQERKYCYQWDTLQSYQELIKAFYAVDATTVADAEYINLDSLLQKDMRIQGDGEQPQILIYHTHSKEDFVDSVPGDTSTTIVGVGEYLAQILRDTYGYNVIHHTACYDEERDYAYSNSLPEMEELLAQNPSVEVVIDLHRDEMPEDRRLVVELDGRPTAQFMFFNGMSRTTKGKIDHLENPYLADNLAFSFQMQVASNEYYPGIARRIYLKAYRYNMHICPKTLLIELGAQNNTLEEIRNACEPLAHILDLVLSGQEPVKEVQE